MPDRTTAAGRPLLVEEAVAPRTALERFLAPLDDPGGPPRRVVAGGAADLVLLDRPLAAVLADPVGTTVVTTWIGGHPAHGAGPGGP